jgi:hypothetical protein
MIELMGRPPRYKQAMSGALAQRAYLARREHEVQQVARALLAVLEACPQARHLARGEDVRRGVGFLLRHDLTGLVQRFEALVSKPSD